MKTLDDLLAIEEIHQLKARYFRYLDSKQWDAFPSLFTSDAVFDMRNGLGEMSDPAAIMHGPVNITNFVRSAVHRMVTVHHGHMPEIRIVSPTTAEGTWAMEDVLCSCNASNVGFKALRGYGHYWETYERRDGVWQIKTLKLTRLRVDVD
jgi:hypothetical protein